MIQKGIYQHYKGPKYEVLGTALQTETREVLVIYKALYELQDDPGTDFFTRSLSMFTQEVEVEGKYIKRFQFIDDIDPQV